MLVKDVLDTFDGKLPIFEVQVKDKLESINENYHIEFITLQQSFDLARKLKLREILILPRQETIRV